MPALLDIVPHCFPLWVVSVRASNAREHTIVSREVYLALVAIKVGQKAFCFCHYMMTYDLGHPCFKVQCSSGKVLGKLSHPLEVMDLSELNYARTLIAA